MRVWAVRGFHSLGGTWVQESAALTRAMTASGKIADLSDIPGPKVDKHSTGGMSSHTHQIVYHTKITSFTSGTRKARAVRSKVY